MIPMPVTLSLSTVHICPGPCSVAETSELELHKIFHNVCLANVSDAVAPRSPSQAEAFLRLFTWSFLAMIMAMNRARFPRSSCKRS